MFCRLLSVAMLLSAFAVTTVSTAADDISLRVAVFDADATPLIGSPVAYAPVRRILDPLHARGIVLLPAQQSPIVLCAVDWIGISNSGHDLWRTTLAEAAGTTPSRVAVHTLHQHDTPRFDSSAIALFASHDQAAAHFDDAFARQVLQRTANAVKESILSARPVSHVGCGKARVEKVASNRRILGPDGKVAIVRYSSSRIPEAIAAPEGVIDPWLRLVSLWDHDQPLVCLSYYATHPQSYYGKGDVTSEFVGLARAEREQQLSVMHVHFTGAGGNVAAGKYNDGSTEMRPVLTRRLAEGMRQAWETTVKTPIRAGDVQWRVQSVALPVAEDLQAERLRTQLAGDKTSDAGRLSAAADLAWLERCQRGHEIELSCLQLANVFLLHMPGELFVEYALAAQAMRPGDTVCMAAYGDYGPGYIATEVAYGQGGYETRPSVSRVAPEVERTLLPALRKLLQ